MEISHEHIRLTSIELGCLWNSYIVFTMETQMYNYFLQHIEDPDIKAFIEQCRLVMEESVSDYTTIFNDIHFPIPRGTTADDVNLKAPRLFSDSFYVNYVKGMTKFTLMQLSMYYSESSRDDVRKMFFSQLNKFNNLDRVATEILQSKGIYIRPPYIPTPDKVTFVKDKDYYTSKKRPLNSLEITQLFYNAQSNALGAALMMGFCQVVKTKELKKIFIKGKDMSHRLYELFSDVLVEGNLTSIPSYIGDVMSTTKSPFSDRFMMTHVFFLNTFGLSNYGLAISQSPRKDLMMLYTKVVAEISLLGNECMTLMIKNGWLEAAPEAPDRTTLIKENQK